jgi:hypothetical protein
MKIILNLLLITFIGTFAQARNHHPHFDLEMTSGEYQEALELAKSVKIFSDGPQEIKSKDDELIEQWLAIGKLNLEWLELINSERPDGAKISFSSAATQNGIPVSAPTNLNMAILKDRWDILFNLLPANMKAVLFEKKSMTKDLPVPTDREYIEWGKQVDSAYQSAARYKLLLPYKEEYKAEAARDVRGYLSLRDEPNLDETLKNFSTQTEGKKNFLKKALMRVCRNSGLETSICQNDLEIMINSNMVHEFKNTYWPHAVVNYNSFFDLSDLRTDIVWPQNSSIATVPFLDPQNEKVKNYLSTNIEDEWKWGDWGLKLEFVPTYAQGMTHIVFEPGTTPHVNSNSTITMDANAPLSEYDVQWTIRHEYGHILGFPDCYAEFFDEEEDGFVGYNWT